MNPQPTPYYRISATIVSAMILGQLMFAGVSWFLTKSGARTPSPEAVTGVLYYIWMGLSFVSVIGAFYLRQRITGIRDTPQGMQEIRDGSASASQIQNQVIIMWALLEGSGLLGIVIYFLNGLQSQLFAAVGYVIMCALVFFPRREWFENIREA